ncbi:TPA: hypothetical protein I8510_004052 [Aeromonas hydrophila]|nr:hypothetical protein [Aeromonas hydrophila]
MTKKYLFTALRVARGITTNAMLRAFDRVLDVAIFAVLVKSFPWLSIAIQGLAC